MSIKDIRKLGDPILREKCTEVKEEELNELVDITDKMFTLVAEFRQQYHRGRAIAAPQAGLSKRIICINTDRKHVIINPEVISTGDELMEIWDDCMSFPNLLVKVLRKRDITISFMDNNWNRVIWELTGDMSELLQHELDHLDGILAIDRAIDSDSFRWSED